MAFGKTSACPEAVISRFADADRKSRIMVSSTCSWTGHSGPRDGRGQPDTLLRDSNFRGLGDNRDSELLGVHAMPTFGQSTAKVAAWNLAGFKAIRAERLNLQAKGLALLDAEVVALVEVNPISAIESLRNRLENDYKVVYKTSILPQNNKLNIGVLFKKGVTAKKPRFIAGSDLGNPELRQAFVVDMKVGGFDFMFIIVHLKSSRRAADQKTRDKQAKVIGDFITDLRVTQKKREDILLVGDFNMIPGQDVSNFHHLGGDDLMDFVSSWDLQDRYSHILPAGRANLLDGYAISRLYSTEYIRGSLRVFPMHWGMNLGREKFRKTVSDHLPFVASYRIHRDTG